MTTAIVNSVRLEIMPTDDGWIVWAEYGGYRKKFYVWRRNGRIGWASPWVPPGYFSVMHQAVKEWRNEYLPKYRQAQAHAQGDPVE